VILGDRLEPEGFNVIHKTIYLFFIVY
jgi:hypothetical protein